MAHGRFGTAITCMDGRVQLPITQWVKEHYHVDYVDMITEPGLDKVLAQGSVAQLESVQDRVRISVQAHGSGIVVIAGHADCAGNPVSQEEHWRQIGQAVQVVCAWGFAAQVIGLWVDHTWQVTQVPL